MRSFRSSGYCLHMLLLTLLLTGIMPAPDSGAAESGEKPAKDWEFLVMPYMWMTGINGDVTVRGTTSDVDVNFSDILKNFDFGAQVHIEAWWKRRYGLFFDPTYLKLSSKKDIPLGNGIEVDKVTSKQWLVEAGGFYRLGEWPLGSPASNYAERAKPSLALDALAGGRFMYTDVDIRLEGTTPSSVGGDVHWLDLFIGGRMELNITEKVPFTLRTDIGGFGFGFSSDIAWNLVTHIGYELPWYGITPAIGYRLLYVDYDNGKGQNRFVYNTWTHGPIIGIAFRF